MKKVIIILLIGILVFPLVGVFKVDAATFSEDEDFVLGVAYPSDAKYIDRSYFTDDDESYYTTIKGSLSENDIDYYQFLLPFDTMLDIGDFAKYTNGVIQTDSLEFTLTGYDNGKATVYREDDLYDGVEAKAGIYLLEVKAVDNYVSKTTGWWIFKKTVKYYPSEYRFFINYQEEEYDEQTNFTVYDAKLDNISGAIWTNDIHDKYNGAAHISKRNEYNVGLINDLEKFTGLHNLYENEFLYKRVYIFDQELMDLYVETFRQMEELMTAAVSEYDQNIELGPYGKLAESVGLDEEYQATSKIAIASKDVKSNVVDVLKICKTTADVVDDLSLEEIPVAGTALKIVGLLDKEIVDQYESYQLILLISTVLNAIDVTNLEYVEQNIDEYVEYITIMSDVLSDMIYSTYDISSVIEFVDDMLNNLDAYSSNDGDSPLREDDYVTIDIIGQFGLFDMYENADGSGYSDQIRVKMVIKSDDEIIDDYVNYHSGRSILNTKMFSNLKSKNEYVITERIREVLFSFSGEFSFAYKDECNSSLGSTNAIIDKDSGIVEIENTISADNVIKILKKDVYVYDTNLGYQEFEVYLKNTKDDNLDHAMLLTSNSTVNPGEYDVLFGVKNPANGNTIFATSGSSQLQLILDVYIGVAGGNGSTGGISGPVTFAMS